MFSCHPTHRLQLLIDPVEVETQVIARQTGVGAPAGALGNQQGSL